MPTELNLQKGFAIGDNIKIGSCFFRIRGRDNIFMPVSFSSTAAAAILDYTDVTQLNPPRSQLYHIYGIIPMQNVTFRIRQPSSTDRWSTERNPSTGELTERENCIGGMQNVEVFILENDEPFIRIENHNSVSVTPVVKFYGWKYLVEELRVPPPQFTEIQIGGIGVGR